MSKPPKGLKVTGRLQIEIDGDRMIITPADGDLTMVSTFDRESLTVHFHHALSGWYVEQETPVGGKPEGNNDDAGHRSG